MKRNKSKAIITLFITVLFNQINYGQTVSIGNQIWMSQNLNVAKFRNGDPIPEAKTDADWVAAIDNKQPAWCYYNNDPIYGEKYGKIYNWFAVNDARGLAPTGYHIPTKEEWIILQKYLATDVGKKMKSASGWVRYITEESITCLICKDWNAEYRKKVPCHTCKDTRRVTVPTTNTGNGTNLSGFAGLPGGYRNYFLQCSEIGKTGMWWSSTEDGINNAWYCTLNYFGSDLNIAAYMKNFGMSVRCIRD